MEKEKGKSPVKSNAGHPKSKTDSKRDSLRRHAVKEIRENLRANTLSLTNDNSASDPTGLATASSMSPPLGSLPGAAITGPGTNTASAGSSVSLNPLGLPPATAGLNTSASNLAAGGGNDGINPDIFPYWRDIVRHFVAIKSGTLKDKLHAVAEMGYVAWNGGDLAQNHIGKSGVLELFVAMLQDVDSPPPLKLRVLQSLTIVCRNHSPNQETLGSLHYVAILDRLLLHEVEEIRKWAAHALFFLLCGSASTQNAALKIENLKEHLIRVSYDDWDSWTYNDAQEVLMLLGYIPPGEVALDPNAAPEFSLTRAPLLLRQSSRAAKAERM